MPTPRWKLQMRTILAIFSMVLTFVYVLLIGMQFYRASINYLSKTFSSQGNNTLTYAAQALEKKLTSVYNVIGSLPQDQSIVSMLTQFDEAPIGQKLQTQNELSTLRGMMEVASPDIATLVVFTKERMLDSAESTLKLYDVNQQDFYDYFGLPPNTEEISLYWPVPPRSEEKSPFTGMAQRIFFVVPVRSYTSTATLCVLLKNDFFKDLTPDTSDIAITDFKGKTLYNNTHLPDSSVAALATDYQVTGRQSADAIFTNVEAFSGFTVLYTGETVLLERSMRQVRLWLLFVYSFVLLGSILVAKRVARSLIEPYEQFIDLMDRENTLEKPLGKPKLPHKRFGIHESVLFYLMGTVLTCTMLVFLLSFTFFSRFVKDTTGSFLEASFQQAYSNVQAMINNMVSSAVYIGYDTDTQNALTSDRDNAPYVMDKLNLRLFQYDTTVGLYKQNDQVLFLTNSYDYDLTFPGPEPENAMPVPGDSNLYWSYRQGFKSNDCITLYTMIHNRSSLYFEQIGYISANVDELILEKQYSQMTSSQCAMMLVARDGTIVSHSNKSLIGTHLDLSQLSPTAQRKNVPITNTPYYLTMVYDEEAITAESHTFFISIMYLLIILLIVLFLLATLFAYLIGKPFNRLSERLVEVSDTFHWPLETADSIIEEISQLYLRFRRMSERIRVLHNESLEADRRRHELELSRNQAQYQMLQAQINPHFLYNTFESINFMIRAGEEESAIGMMNSLSYMLRFAARKDKGEIPLSEELEYTQEYVDIMLVRYAGIIDITMHFDETTLGLYTIKFFLQPLVENAITHGIKPNGGGTIQVTGTVANERLIIIVRDDGVGMDAQKLQALTRSLSREERSSHIGLRNIQNRIRLMYGEPFGLYLSSSPGEGTSVTVMLPVIRENPDRAPEHS